MYHRVTEAVPSVTSPTINVSPAQFRRQIEGLLDRGFVIWPLHRLLRTIEQGKQVPPYVTALTFDDGFEGVYHHVWPVLQELRVTATIFLATAYLGSNAPFPFDHWGRKHTDAVPPSTYRPLTIEHCRQMLASGAIDVGAHTHTHEDYRSRVEDFRRDLEMNVDFLRREFGTTDVTFAFPYGTPRLGFASDALVEAAKATGVCCSLTTESATIGRDQSPFTWGRFNAFPWDTGATLAAKLNGWYSWAPRLKQRVLGRSQRPEVRGQKAEGRRQKDEGRGQHSPLVSVIVPTFNRAHWLDEAIASLLAQRTDQRFEFEVVVIDNASTDHTPDVVNRIAAASDVTVRYLRQEKRGDAPTRNLGIRESKGEWLAFFDDDQLAHQDWLLNLLAAAEFAGSEIVGGCVQLAVDQRELNELGSWCREALRETNLHSELHPYTGRELPGTGNALVSRAVFDELGLFDETFERGGSDYDFFSRARAARIAQWYAPAAIILHRVDRERLSSERLRADAFSGGWEHAGYFDYEQHGTARLLQGCIGRVAHAFFVHLPLLALDWLACNRSQVVGRRTRLWRTEGYVRRTLSILGSKLLPRQGLFRSLLSRKQRQNAS